MQIISNTQHLPMLTLLYYVVYFSCFSSLMLDMISRASDRALRVLWCTGFQTSCVWTSQPAQSSWQPCANTGAVWTNTPLVRGGRVHRTLQWATHTTQTTLQTHGDTQKLIDEPLSHKKHTLLPCGSKSSYTNWERFPYTRHITHI